MMSNKLSRFQAPPVVETAIGVQFEPLVGFTNAHSGWFWKKYLDQTWTKVQQAVALPDQFERFGEDRKWGPLHSIKLVQAAEPDRTQFMTSDDERMIQIQASRFHHNWRKQNADYPSHENLLNEFNARFSDFKKFATDAGLGAIQPNQWEITYVNQILRGNLWNTFADWKNIFPWFNVPSDRFNDQQFDGFAGEWHLTIGDNCGRLHVSLRHARVQNNEMPETILLQLTARGPIDATINRSLCDGLAIGHRAIVASFENMTSSPAHAAWKKMENE